jgi:hypothetical protein
LGEEDLVGPHEASEDAAGQMRCEVDLLLEFSAAEARVGERRPLRRADGHDEAGGDEEGGPEFGPVGTICGAADLKAHPESIAKIRRRSSGEPGAGSEERRGRREEGGGRREEEEGAPRPVNQLDIRRGSRLTARCVK